PDGYSVLATNDNVASAPHILKLGVDYLKELVPVIQLARQPLALAAHPTLGVSSVAELIATAKQRPGLGCATSRAGSNQHVLLEWFAQMAGIKLDHVPYRGAGQAINDLVAGHVRAAFLGPTALIPHYKSGNLRLLAQSSETRSPNLPEVPTLQEAGFKGLVLETWYAAFVPLGTPPSASRASTPRWTRRWRIQRPAKACCKRRPSRSAAARSNSRASRGPTPKNTHGSRANSTSRRTRSARSAGVEAAGW